MTFGRTIDLAWEDGTTNITINRTQNLDFDLALPITSVFSELCAEIRDVGPEAIQERVRQLSDTRLEEVEVFLALSWRLFQHGQIDAKEQIVLAAVFLAMLEGLESCGYTLTPSASGASLAVRTLDVSSRKYLLGATDKIMRKMRAACPELWVFIQMLSMATSTFSPKDQAGTRYGAYPPFLLVFLFMGFHISRDAAGGPMAGKKVQMAQRQLPLPCATCHKHIVRGQRFYFARDGKGRARPFHESPCPERVLQPVPAIVAASETATIAGTDEAPKRESALSPQLPAPPAPPPEVQEPQESDPKLELELVRTELEEARKWIDVVGDEHTVELNQLRASHEREITLLRQQKAQSCPPLDPEMVDSIFWKSLYERTNSALLALSDRNKIVEERFRFVCKENNRLRKNTEKMARVVKQLRKVAIETIENL